MTEGLDALRRYLDAVGSRQIYKYLAGVNGYGVTPSVVTAASLPNVQAFFDDPGLFDAGAGRDGLGLLQCLMFGRPLVRDGMDGLALAAAEELAAAGLLRASPDGGGFLPGDRQLISAFGYDLFVDRRIHFGGGGLHDVYIGPDSYWLLYYVDLSRVRRHDRAVDLCTGSGVGALHLSSASDHVVATDIGDAPLGLAGINRRLNGREDRIAIRLEPLDRTLDGRERFDVLTCNPPFVALPPGYGGTLYASGTDVDGLGYMREIVGRLPAALNPGGSAYLVADLYGDARGPHFLPEVERLAERHRLAVDAYVDHVIPARDQIPAMANFALRAGRGDAAPDRVAADIAAFQRDVLRADRYFLTTFKLTAAAERPGLRVMRRDPPPAAARPPAWPALLQADPSLAAA